MKTPLLHLRFCNVILESQLSSTELLHENIKWHDSEAKSEVIQSDHLHQDPNHITMLKLSSPVRCSRGYISFMAVC